MHGGMRVLGLSIITDQCLPDALEPASSRRSSRRRRAPSRSSPRSCAACWSGYDGRRRDARYTPAAAGPAGATTLEQELLARWDEEDLFARTLEARAGGEPFVFFEGPPTANGRPGIHHVFARTIKDLFCRHRAMKGYRVPRKAGWDTHGLPVEIEVEKQLGISGKQQIEALGVAEFNRLCRESVCKYRGDWEKLSERIGYWLDYERSVRHVHERLRRERVVGAGDAATSKGLLYRGHKILPYCPRCGTALSSHEVAQGYEDVEDPSVYVALDLGRWTARWRTRRRMPGRTARRILVWTTTPWTLVSNAALAVHPGARRTSSCGKTDSDGHAHDHPRRVARAARCSATTTRRAGRRAARSRARSWWARAIARPLDWLPYPRRDEARGHRRRELRERGRRHRASCTWRPRSARTTTRRGGATTWRSCSR